MANTATAKSATNGSESNKSDRAELEAQIERIKSDIAELSSTLSTIGRRRLRDAKSDADRRVADMTGAGEQMLDDLRLQVTALEKDLRRTVHDRPLQTLGLAAAFGFLCAMMMRR